MGSLPLSHTGTHTGTHVLPVSHRYNILPPTASSPLLLPPPSLPFPTTFPFSSPSSSPPPTFPSPA